MTLDQAPQMNIPQYNPQNGQPQHFPPQQGGAYYPQNYAEPNQAAYQVPPQNVQSAQFAPKQDQMPPQPLQQPSPALQVNQNPNYQSGSSNIFGQSQQQSSPPQTFFIPVQFKDSPEIILYEPENAFKNKYLILLLDLLLAGLGHLALGQFEKAIYFMAVNIISFIACYVLSYFAVFVVIFIVLLKIVVMYDGYIMADKLEREGYIFRGEMVFTFICPFIDKIIKDVRFFKTGEPNDPRNSPILA